MAKQIGKAGSGARRIGIKKTLIAYGLLLAFLVIGCWMATAGGALTQHFGLLGKYIGPTITVIGLGLFLAAIKIASSDDIDEVDKRLDKWFKGANAEVKVSDILGNLPSGFVVLNDIRCPVGNIDHLVIGPTGVFVVETKSHRGTITVLPDGHLRRNGKLLEKDFVKQVLGQVSWLKKELSDNGIAVPYVNAVIVFTQGFVKVYKPIKGVHVVSKKWLVKHIEEHNGSLSEQIREQIVTHLSRFVEN